MRKAGVPIPRRLLSEELATQGQLVILDVTDQGLRRQVKVARLYQDSLPRYELVEPHIVWASEGRLTLTGFERGKNDQGAPVDYAQSWLCTLEGTPSERNNAAPAIRLPRVER